MQQGKEPRPGEAAIGLPTAFDAGIYFIGRIRTPWRETSACPKGSRGCSDVEATIEIDPRYAQGLQDLSRHSHAIALYWLNQSRRDLILQVPRHLGEPRGVFALRSPVRPNPIGLAVVEVLGVEGTCVRIRNIDCVDNTPLVDLKPYFASLDAVPEAT